MIGLAGWGVLGTRGAKPVRHCRHDLPLILRGSARGCAANHAMAPDSGSIRGRVGRHEVEAASRRRVLAVLRRCGGREARGDDVAGMHHHDRKSLGAESGAEA